MTAIKSYLRSTAQGPLNAQLICKDIRFFCRFEYDLGALRRGTPLRVRSRVQKPCLMRYLPHNQCDGRPHSTPTSGTINFSSIAVRRTYSPRAPAWDTRLATRSVVLPESSLRDRPNVAHTNQTANADGTSIATSTTQIRKEARHPA